MTPYKRNFTFSDGEVHDISISETSTELQSCDDYTWSITPIVTNLVGLPTYTLEVSNDGVQWFEYNSLSTNVEITDAIDDVHLAFTKMRVVHSANGSTGTVTYLFLQKQNG